MKRLKLLAAGLLFPLPSLAATPPPAPAHTVQSQHGVFLGIGASVRDGDPSIYLPIELNPSFRIEPFFSWYEVDTTPGGTAEGRELGAGGFFRFAVREQLQAYAGGRLAFVEIEDAGGDLDGFRIEPTVGAEFWVTRGFSVALEAYLYREDLDGSDAGAAVERESTGSDTRILLRFFP